MDPLSLFTVALGLPAPWEVVDVACDPNSGRIDFHRAFAPGTRFSCPYCGAEHQPVHDTLKRDWRHPSLFQFQAYIHTKQGAPCALRDLRQDYPGRGALGTPQPRLQPTDGGFTGHFSVKRWRSFRSLNYLASATGASGAPSIITSIGRTLKRTSRPSPRLVSSRPPRGVDTVTCGHNYIR